MYMILAIGLSYNTSNSICMYIAGCLHYFYLGGFQLEFVSIGQVIIIIKAFILESKSCKGFFLNKFSTNESTQIITGHVFYI